MKKKIYTYLGVFIFLAISRFIPHPPNFTNVLALSFYVPALLGIRYLPVLIISFAITDLYIGYHYATHWTWGSILIIGLLATFIKKNIIFRLSGALLGVIIFFLITNFGVWISGVHSINYNGLLNTYLFAIPFFLNNLIATFIFSILIEIIYAFFNLKINILNKKLK